MALALMPILWAITLTVVLALSLLRAWDRHAWPTWRSLSEPGRLRIEALANATRHQVELIRGFFALAERDAHEGSTERAHHWLESALAGTQRLIDDMRSALLQWSLRARALAALRPVRLPRVSEVSGLDLRALVLTWRVADRMVVTSRGRFGLRTRVLRAAFDTLRRRCRHLKLPSLVRAKWATAHSLTTNLDTLSAQSVETYRTLETALESRPLTPEKPSTTS